MNRQGRIIAAAAIFIFALGLLRVTTDQDPFSDLLSTISRPFSKTLNSLKPDIEMETAEQDQLLAQQNQDLEAENRKLRDELDLEERYGEVVTAEIERADTASFRKTVWVNRGGQHGVKKGQAVLADRFLIGIVASANNRTAEIQLITDPDFRATGKAGGVNGVVKLLKGSLVFDLVPKKTISDTLLVTDGIDGKFAPGIPIANVGERLDEESSVFSVYRLQLPKNPVDVQFVSIVVGE